jgi:hypothetical protein
MTEPTEYRGPYYVYTLVDPRDGKPFYVGKGKGDRVLKHFGDWRRGRVSNWAKWLRITQIVKAGLKPEHSILVDGLTEAEALTVEHAMICALRERGDEITNQRAGPRVERQAAIQLARMASERLAASKVDMN